MVNKVYILVAVIACVLLQTVSAQSLQPGFDKNELLEVMYVSARTGGNEDYVNDSVHPIPEPESFNRIYRSEPMGFDNMWELWTDGGNSAIITIRGSTGTSKSWLANYYAAMLPAQGEIIFPNGDTTSYQFAENPRAAVHSGYAVCAAYLIRDILPVMDSCYQNGIQGFIVTGHSQGGGLSYLVTAWIRYLQKIQRIPENICFKTYCTAAPRVGNLYFAYDYEQLTAGGWSYNLINPLDWVPEMPLTVQTVYDFNPLNPFAHADEAFKNQKLPKRIALSHIYRKLKRHPEKAQENYRTYLGEKLESSVKKEVGNITIPEYTDCMHYVRTGQSLVLSPDENYHREFPSDPDKIFTHHAHHAYIFLIEHAMSKE